MSPSQAVLLSNQHQQLLLRDLQGSPVSFTYVCQPAYKVHLVSLSYQL